MRPAILDIFDGKIAVMSAHAALQKNADTAYPYEQESNFLWLTGIQEQGWLLIVDGIAKVVRLVAPTIADQHQLFDGSLTHDEVRRVSGIETILNTDEADDLLGALAREHETVYTLAEHPHADHFDFFVNPAPVALHKRLSELFHSVQDCRLLLAQQRAIKRQDEVATIQRAIDVTVAAFADVHDTLATVRTEYEIEAEFNYRFTRAGTDGHAYDPIIAGGVHACTLHYGKNDADLPENGLVLLDVGARVNGYAADITRTYAIGTPTDRQVAVHAAVELAHHDIIALLAPGVSVKTYHEQVDEIMKRALNSVGLLQSDDDYRRYFPHAISHGLGVDVHDALGRPEMFKPGMVLTVEPGIYIPEEGIGVRIEDDILITESGTVNLSAALPTGL